MRVAIITESFPPDVNGVAHCVLRVAELLTSYGHHPLVVAPQPPVRTADSFPFPVVRVPAVPLPGYPSFRLGLPSRRVRAALVRHRTEVVHLASPVCLGAHGAAVARRLGLPTIAVYQTDLPSYARAYRLGRAGEAFAWRWLRGIHNGAARTLAPSTVTATGLLGQSIDNVWLWGRGVDTRRFDPAKRSLHLRAALLAQEGRAQGGPARYGPAQDGPAQEGPAQEGRAGRPSAGGQGAGAQGRAARGLRGPPGHREARRAAGRDHRAGRGPAGHRGGRAGRGDAAPADSGRHLPWRAPGRGAGGHLRQSRRVRAQRDL